jgi:hypothetical protein
VSTKKIKDVQSSVEVMGVVQTLRGARKTMYDLCVLEFNCPIDVLRRNLIVRNIFLVSQ